MRASVLRLREFGSCDVGLSALGRFLLNYIPPRSVAGIAVEQQALCSASTDRNGSGPVKTTSLKQPVRLGYSDQRQISIALRTLTDRGASGAFGRGAVIAGGDYDRPKLADPVEKLRFRKRIH